MSSVSVVEIERSGETAEERVARLLERIRSREARVGVVGLGYVGLPLTLVFNEKGFPVAGFDRTSGTSTPSGSPARTPPAATRRLPISAGSRNATRC
jgi:phosphoglycerate dehydrogenase-like enzyme